MPVVHRPVNTATIISAITVEAMTATIHRFFEEAVLFSGTERNLLASGRIHRAMTAAGADLEPGQVAEFYARIRREFKIAAQTIIHTDVPDAASPEFIHALELVWKHPVYTPDALDPIFG